MLKEKLSKLFKDEGNNKKKTENLIFLLIILIITVVSINLIWKDDDTPKNNSTNTLNKQIVEKKNEVSNQLNLEEKLENILSKISGVGNVEVLITYNETEEIVPVYNTKDKTSVINETDSTGRNQNYARKW